MSEKPTDVFFYHLEHQTLERVLPSLLEKTLARGWRAVVQAGSEDRLEAIDLALWTYADDSFLPHGTARVGHASEQPVYLTLGDETPNGAGVRFLVDGAEAQDLQRRRAFRLRLRWSRSRRRRFGTRAMDGGEGRRLRGHLLAAIPKRALGAEGLAAIAPFGRR